MYAPNSSVCLAAEHIGLFKQVDKVKIVKINESDYGATEFPSKILNGITSTKGLFPQEPKAWSISVD